MSEEGAALSPAPWEGLFEEAYAPENRQPVGIWAFDNVRLRAGGPFGDRFVVEETPWLRDPLLCLPDNSIEEILLMCCAQGGKTVSMQAAACWALALQPGPTMFVMHTNDAVKEFAKDRLIPMIESCDALIAQLPADKNKKTWKAIHFLNATLLLGPANESFLRSHTIRWLFGDECSRWKPGKMQQARERTKRIWNRRRWFSSTPLDPEDDFTISFKKTDQREWHLRCQNPKCDKLINPDFEKVIRWEESERTKPGGEWDFNALRDTVRMVCPHCGHEHWQRRDEKNQLRPESEEQWRAMTQRGAYVPMNPNAPSEKVGFRFNALTLPPSVLSWFSLVEMWIHARAEELKGNTAALRELVTLNFAQPFDAKKYFTVQMPTLEDYDATKAWPEEAIRFMTVDCQQHLAKFFIVVRAWAKDGASRLLAFEEVHSFQEVEEVRIKWGVKPNHTGIDVGYQQYQVMPEALKYGWWAFKGDHVVDYLHVIKGRKVKRPYSQVYRADPRSGKTFAGRATVPFVRWSNPTIKDLLFNLKSGRGVPWGVCDLGDKTMMYAEGLDSERKREVFDKYGRAIMMWKAFRANHPWDCECMQVAFACMARMFSADSADVAAAAAAGEPEAAAA